MTNFSALRDQSVHAEYRILTPEVLKLGYETNVLEVNVPKCDIDEWQPDQVIDHRIAYKNLKQLLKVKNNVRTGYHTEFLYSLMDAATKLQGKYLPVQHQTLDVGDTVLIRDPFYKSTQFPLGLITKVIKNDVGECTAVGIKKGNFSNIVRDVSDVILLVKNVEANECSSPLENGEGSEVDDSSVQLEGLSDSNPRRTNRRAAAIRSQQLTRLMV